MSAGLARNLGTVDYSDRMIELCASTLEAAFDRSPAVGHEPVRGRDELHVLRHEREQVEPALVRDLSAAVGHAAWQLEVRRDLARVHRELHERRAEEHEVSAVGLPERGLACLVRAWEGGARRAQRDAVPGRRHLGLRLIVAFQRGGGLVVWGGTVDVEGRRILRIPRTAVSLEHVC